MESSTPPASASADDSNAQDPLALPNTNDNIGLYHGDVNRDQNGICGNESALSISCNNDKENSHSDNPTSGIYSNDPSIIKHEEHPLNNEQRLQYDANHQMSSNYANSDQQKMNHLNMQQQQQQNLHEPHKTFSHSIENLSKTTEKCAPNEMKIFPNLIDGHDQYDDGYETGVGDLLSHKYKLPSLPPPSSSPYSSLSSSSMSTISNATTTPTNLVNPQQQQSPSYMGGNGNAGNNMNQYQQQQQQQQQQLYNQNHQQYQSMQHPIPPQSHQNSFNYHHMFGRIQQQHQQPQQLSGAIKNEPPMTPTDNDPYRFVDDDLSNGINSSGMHGSILPHHQHMSPAGMSGNYSTSSSPMPPQMQQQASTGNASMMQFNDHMSPHHQQHMHGHQHMNHMNHQQQMQSHMNPHLMNGNINSPSIGHGGMNPMLMNDTPKKRGRKKKLRDENGNPVEDRPVKERKKHDRFNGMPEEEVTKRTLPDHLTGNLDIVIVGINPGLFAAFKGHHYAGPGNHFWKCLYLSGLTSVQMTAEEDYKLMQYGIGFTNMVQRPTKGSADLTRKEIKEGSRILLDKIRKFQPKIAVFNGKLIFEVFSGKKDFCFGKQPETVEGTNTYMWVMPSSSARCAQLPRAADKVPFYAALKKFRDYLNGLVPEYDESDYVFNDPKYSQISTEAELKEEAIAFTSLEGGEVVLADPNKKKRGRPKKVRGENGEEIPTPKQRKNNENLSLDGNDDDPTKKKRGRPKKNKDGTTTLAAPSKKKTSKQSNKDQMMDSNSPQNLTPPSSVPPQGVDMNSMPHHNPQGTQHQQHAGMLNNNCNNGNINRPFLPPMESPTAINYNGAINQQNHMQQQNHQQSQNTSPVNLCFPQANLEQVAQPEISPHHQQAYQRRQTPSIHQQQMFGTNSSSPDMPSDMSANISSEQMTSPIASSPTLAPSEFEPPQAVANGRSSNELNPYSQMQATNSLEQQQHQTHSPSSQTQSPIGMAGLYSQHQQSQQPQMSHMISNISNGSPYSPYSRQHSQQQVQHQQQQQQQQQQQPSYPNHQQSPHHHGVPNNNANAKQINQHMNGGTDPYKDVATKSLSGLESLVDQIPNLNEQEAAALGSLTTPHNGTPNLAATSPSVASPSSLLPSLGPPHHHSHYPYTSHAASQSPYSANPFSVSSLTSSTYPSAAAAAMNSYHQNLMNSSHLTSSFMEPPHMPVPVSPLYHSYQQQGYPGYAPPHPSALHMSNYPYYTNTGYTQAPGSSYHHSMFDRINF